MKQQEFKVLGHKVPYNVPADSAEFNKLDPKRADAACDEGNNNIVYRVMNPDTRDYFLHGITADEVKALAEKTGRPPIEPWVGVEEDSGIERKTVPVKGKDGQPRLKDGSPVVRFDPDDSEERYYNRVLATLVEQKKFASEDAARAHYQPIIEAIAGAIPFDITEKEHKERGPIKLALKYKQAAAVAIVRGTVERVNAQLATTIGKQFTATGDTTKMFTGTATVGTGDTAQQVPYNVSDKDAEALGRLLKEHREFLADQQVNAMVS